MQLSVVILLQENDDTSLLLEATDDYTLKITLTNRARILNDLMAFPTYFPDILPEGCGKSGFA